jgi:hypothetical protein
LGQFSLTLHPDKTRLLESGRYAAQNRQERGLGKPETFQFLGFVHSCRRATAGEFVVHRHTAADRLRAKPKKSRRSYASAGTTQSLTWANGWDQWYAATASTTVFPATDEPLRSFAMK